AMLVPSSCCVLASLLALWRPLPVVPAAAPPAASSSTPAVAPTAAPGPASVPGAATTDAAGGASRTGPSAGGAPTSSATTTVVADPVGAPASTQVVPASTAVPAGAKPQRVYLVIDRRTDAKGIVESENADEIVVRWKDTVQTFPKSRLLRIDRLVDPEPGQKGTVMLADGELRRGVIIEDGYDEVVMEIEGIRTKFPRSAVDNVHLEPTFEQAYKRLADEIAPNDFTRRVELARWLIEQRRYDIAQRELADITSATDNPEAERLFKQVNAQLLLGGARSTEGGATDVGDGPASAASRAGGTAAGPAHRASGPVDQRDLLPSRLLTKEDVNIIRVYELDLKDPPRMSVSPATIRAMIEGYAASDLIPASSQERTALFRLDPVQLVSLMFRLKARDLYPDIEVQSEPPHLNLFRQRVHNAWLIPSCATSRCHGGVDAGRFFLHNRNYKDERVRYTNLVILDQLQLDGRGGARRLIDYDDPMMSLIVQYGLPRTEARFPHPDVPGWRPVFTESNRKLLDDTLKWIRSMFRPRPKYPIEYEPPVLTVPDRRDAGGDVPVDR
ncbi:MAG: hypothetical protein U0575_16485, partial [Phycisphaerales bacterium]